MKIISDLIELLKNMELFKNLSKVAYIVIISCSIFLFFLKSWFPFNTSILRILWVVSLAIIILYLTDLMHSHLQTLEIISIDSRLNVLQGTKMIAFIEPWVIDLVQKKPKLFETKSISNKGEKTDSFSLYKGFLE